jgi:ATP-dependent Clp protease ATP-binding subunit ClpA
MFVESSLFSNIISLQHALSRKDILAILDCRLKEVEDRLEDRKIKLDVDRESKEYLMSVGYSPSYGARPINRAIQSELLNPLSILLLSGRVLDNETVKVRFDGPHNRIIVTPNHEGLSGMDVDQDDDDDDIDIEEMD